MTRELIAMQLWCDVYCGAREKGSMEPEYYAGEALAKFCEAFPNDPPQTPPVPAPPPSFGDVFNERDRQRADAEIALINAHFGGSES